MSLPAVAYRIYEKQTDQGSRRCRRCRTTSASCWTATADGPARRASRPPRKDTRRARDHIADLLEWCRGLGIGMVTLWLLSTDNLRRADEEVSSLLTIITDVVDDLAAPDQPWKLRIVGSMDVLAAPRWRPGSWPPSCAPPTATGLEVNIAVGYGGRQEIADAVRSLLEAEGRCGRVAPPGDRRPRRRRHRRAPLHLRPARPRSGDPHLRGAAAVRVPALAERRTPSSGSATPTGPTSAGSTSCGRCVTTPPGTVASANSSTGGSVSSARRPGGVPAVTATPAVGDTGAHPHR